MNVEPSSSDCGRKKSAIARNDGILRHTNQDAPARSPAPALFFPRHYPCQQRLISLVGANVLGRFSMAGFEVIIYGRFWVIAEVQWFQGRHRLTKIGTAVDPFYSLR